MKKILFLIFFTVISYNFSQNTPKGNLEGIVLDKNNKSPLIGVNIFLKDKNSGTTTNTTGNYRFENLPVGTYTIQFSYIGYEKITKTDVILRPKRTSYLNIDLQSSTLSRPIGPSEEPSTGK